MRMMLASLGIELVMLADLALVAEQEATDAHWSGRLFGTMPQLSQIILAVFGLMKESAAAECS